MFPVEYSEEERSEDALTAKMGQVRQLVVQQWKKLQVPYSQLIFCLLP